MQQPFDVTPSAPHNMAQGPMTVQDVSHNDLGAAMASVQSAGGILVKFFYTRVQITTNNAAENGKWDTRLCVAKQPKADRATVATQYITPEEAKRLFPREYKYFTENEDVPMDGTPLQELPGATMSQIGMLTIHGLRTIEDLAELSAEQAKEIGFEAIRAHKLAKSWLERSEGEKDTIDAATVEANYQQELSAVRQSEQALKDRIRELEIQNAALQNVGGGNQSQAAPQIAGEPVAIDSKEDLPDIDDMPNPLLEGSAVVEADDPLR